MCGIVLLLAAYVTVTCMRSRSKYGAIEWVRSHASGGWVLRVGKMWMRARRWVDSCTALPSHAMLMRFSDAVRAVSLGGLRLQLNSVAWESRASSGSRLRQRNKRSGPLTSAVHHVEIREGWCLLQT